MEQNQINKPFHYDGHMYISTVSSLIEKPPLKMAVVPGDYVMRPYLKGFVFTKTDYDPKLKEIVHVLDSRSNDPGLGGTYYHGETDNGPLLQLFNKYFLPHIPEARFDLSYSYSDLEYDSSDGDCSIERNDMGRKILKKLDCYNNFPILFFLNFEPFVENLSLVIRYEDTNNKIIVWDVIDCQKGKIGVAIKEEKFYNMMGDQMGLAVFSLNATHGIALGNFYVDDIDLEKEGVNLDIFYKMNRNDLLYNKYDWSKHEENRKKWLEERNELKK